MSITNGLLYALEFSIDLADTRAESIWAASPSTTRGQPTQLSSDAKGERLAYAVLFSYQLSSSCSS